MMSWRCLASGRGPMPAPTFSTRFLTLPVAGITQVTAGWASTYFNRICAQDLAPNSDAQAGTGPDQEGVGRGNGRCGRPASVRKLGRHRAPPAQNQVRLRGLEPPRPCGHKNLNLARLPIPPHPQPDEQL